MVDKIYDMKNRIIERITHQINERGVEGVNIGELGELVDMVKDLSEAENNCWQANYYRSVTEAMEHGGSSGYSHGRMGYDRMGRGSWNGNHRRGYDGMGYSDMAESVRMAMQGMTPDERERMREQLRMAMDM